LSSRGRRSRHSRRGSLGSSAAAGSGNHRVKRVHADFAKVQGLVFAERFLNLRDTPAHAQRLLDARQVRHQTLQLCRPTVRRRLVNIKIIIHDGAPCKW
jgi:hypothetical protein